MLLGTFKDSSFQEGVSPLISNLVSPMIEAAIQRAVDSAVSKVQSEVVKPLVEANERLTRHVEEQQQSLKTQQHRIFELERGHSFMCSEVENLKMSVNDLEQYGRRNNLRVSNMTLSPQDVNESDITKRTVEFINENVLKVESGGLAEISADDIDRCHTIGPVRDGKNL